jgi:transcriptional regulator with XRE-family HTH domain
MWQLGRMSNKKKNLRKSFAAELRAARKASGLSQEALADAAGLHRTYVGLIERSERNITIDTIEKLARALGAEVEIRMRRRLL